MNDQEVAKVLLDQIQNGKLVGVEVIGGPTNSFRLVFENAAEERACLTIMPGLKSQIGTGEIVIHPMVNFNIESFRK